jgi:hypothetical protein
VYATDSQVTLLPEGGHHITGDVAARLDDAVNGLVQESHLGAPVSAAFDTVPFQQVRCSV